MRKDKLIENIIRKVILEYSGVSDEILDISNEILSMLFSQSRNFEWKYSMTIGEYHKRFTLDLEGTKTGGLVDEVLVKLFPYDSKKMSFLQAKEIYADKEYLNLSFSPGYNRIKLFIPWPYDGNMDKQGVDYILSSINHEVKHAYQNNKRGGTKISDMYINSLKPTSTKEGDRASYNLMKYYVKSLFYNFDNDEIDSRLQELYIQLGKNDGNLDKCDVYKRFKESIGEYNYLNNILNPRTSFDRRYYSKDRALIQNVLDEMLGGGITIKRFMAYCKDGIERFREHSRRIIGRYRREHPNGTGSFKNYANREIPQSGVFKNSGRMKPEIWRKLLRKYNKMRYGIK